MRHHNLIRGVGLLFLFLLSSACGSVGGGSQSSGSVGPSRTVSDRGAISVDPRGHLPSRVEELLIGRFPGVTVIRLSNGGMQVRVRATSMQGSQDPLWVVDGMPLEPTASDRVLATIDPRQVSRIVVLKDAGSTAIYGARGANGVIELTTRRGIVTEPRQAPPPSNPPRNDPPRSPDI